MRRSVIMLIGVVILIATATSFAVDCGDVNNDGYVNILDIVHLINYKYKAGPDPNCGTDIGTVTDIDGNMYLTVKICNQWWMMENLKVTHYRNGDPIPNVTDGGEWAGLTTGAYCEYNNDIANVDTYGRLYNWYAVDDSRNIAPAGWHVPTDDEWKQLEMCLGMSQAEADATGLRGPVGGKLKETGTTHWLDPNAGATNESGFSALPGGYREYTGNYYHMNYHPGFWTSTEFNSYNAWGRGLSYIDLGVNRGEPSLENNGSKHYGFSVRCVKD